MKIKLECPEARYDSEKRIWCRVSGQLCACQRWCMMKGRAVLTDTAPDCAGGRGGAGETSGAETDGQ